ncbi:MAG: hypothetical protein ABJ308_05000 [Halieaceae bacterium]
MHKISQRIALVCGGLCLAVALVLVLTGSLSSRYILEQQSLAHGQALATRLAREIAPVIANGDLIRLEVTLEDLRQRHQLRTLVVTDLEQRLLSSSGQQAQPDGRHFTAAINIGGNQAGQLELQVAPEPALLEQQRMALALLFLGLLLSLFVTVVAAKWGQQLAQRLQALQDKLQLSDHPQAPVADGDELEALEQAIDLLPLELLQAPLAGSQDGHSYEEAALLYIHLDSLGHYVETLDEQSLLAYTDRQRQLLAAAAALYGGELSVVRQFGVLLSFSGAHASGGPGFRATSVAWLLQQLTTALEQQGSLKQGLAMSCGVGESSRGAQGDIYPALYNQHVIDELSQLVDAGERCILLAEVLAADAEISNRCRLQERSGGVMELAGFEEPYCDLLERQRQLLLRELGISA